METIRLVYPVEGGDLIEAGEASSKMKLTLKKLGLPQDVIRRASICMYEGEINMVIHADGGQAEVEVDANQIVIRMTDTGPGIPDVEQAMQEGFSTASAEVRAKRRFDALQQKGDKTPYAQILAETKQRDKQDSERAIAPLKQAADAVLLDTSGDTVEQSVNAILDIVRRKLG